MCVPIELSTTGTVVHRRGDVDDQYDGRVRLLGADLNGLVGLYDQRNVKLVLNTGRLDLLGDRDVWIVAPVRDLRIFVTVRGELMVLWIIRIV